MIIAAQVNGYIVMSFVESAVNSVKYIAAKDDIGGTVSAINESIALQGLDIRGKLFGKDIESLFEIGNIQITTSGWTYGYDTKRARTADGVTLSLKRGDVISLTDYTDARFYLGWRRENNTYGLEGWHTTDYTLVDDGEYVILLAHITEVDLDSASDLSDLLIITRTTLSERIDEASRCYFRSSIIPTRRQK